MPKLRPSPLFQRWGRDAIRRGDKTQTRRVMTPQPAGTPHYRVGLNELDGEYSGLWEDDARIFSPPHGQPGDVWYLREPLNRGCLSPPGDWVYYADDQSFTSLGSWQWKRDILTSMFMPRRFARTYLTVLDVRLERLHSITEAHARAEGCILPEGYEEVCKMAGGYRAVFRDLWDSINKAKGHGWDKNDWVFAYTFRGATAAEVEAVKGE